MEKIVIGRMIRFFLDQNNMTMKQLGEKLGKTESTISKWVKGSSLPYLKDVSKMTTIFNTSIYSLVYGQQFKISGTNSFKIILDNESNSQKRLRQVMNERCLRQTDILELSKSYQEKFGIKMGKSALSQYVYGIQSPDQHRIYLLAKTLNVSEPWLMGYDVPRERIPYDYSTEDIVTELVSEDINNYVSITNKLSKLSDKEVKIVENLIDSLLQNK
ncbi:helix-turn-helix domain-containing protein [Enterococcus sp. LJL128]